MKPEYKYTVQTRESNPGNTVIRISGHRPVNGIVHDIATELDKPIFGDLNLNRLRSAVSEAWLDVASVINSGGIMSVDGETVLELESPNSEWPKLHMAHIKIPPDFKSRIDAYFPLGHDNDPVFFQEKEGRRILTHDVQDAIGARIGYFYKKNEVGYPRFTVTSLTNQFLLQFVAESKKSREI